MQARTYDTKDLSSSQWKELREWHIEEYGYTCQCCYKDFYHNPSALCVHHGYYEKGLRAWEYDDTTLWWICNSCHGQAHRGMRVVSYHTALCPPQFMDSLATDIARLVTHYVNLQAAEREAAVMQQEIVNAYKTLRHMKANCRCHGGGKNG